MQAETFLFRHEIVAVVIESILWLSTKSIEFQVKTKRKGSLTSFHHHGMHLFFLSPLVPMINTNRCACSTSLSCTARSFSTGHFLPLFFLLFMDIIDSNICHAMFDFFIILPVCNKVSMLRATWYEGTAQLLSLIELKSHLFELYFLAGPLNRWRRGGNRSTRRKPLRASENATYYSPKIQAPSETRTRQ